MENEDPGLSENNIGHLPVELFEIVALNLDPDSLLQISRTCRSIRNRLSSASDSFWRSYCKKWFLPCSQASPDNQDNIIGENIIGENMIALIESRETLRERMKTKKCQVWEVSLRNGTRLIEEEEEEVVHARPRHLYCRGFDGYSSRTYWNGTYIVAEWRGRFGIFEIFKAWDSRTMAPLAPDRLPSGERAITCSITIWKNYLLFSPCTKVINAEVVVLRIFNLEESYRTAKSVTVTVTDQSFNIDSEIGILERMIDSEIGILERMNIGKAAVLHSLQDSILIVQIADGILERKIRLPFQFEMCNLTISYLTRYRVNQNPAASTSSCLCLSTKPNSFLTVTMIDKTTTVARMVRVDNSSAEILRHVYWYFWGITRDGDILRACPHSDGKYCFARIRQDMLQRSAAEGDFELELEDPGSVLENYDILLLEVIVGDRYSQTVSIRDELGIAIIYLTDGEQEWRVLFAVSYLDKHRPPVLLYKIDPMMKIDMLCSSFDHFATMLRVERSILESSSEWILTIYCVSSGRVLGEKRLRQPEQVGEEIGFDWGGMSSGNIFLEGSEFPRRGFLMIKYC